MVLFFAHIPFVVNHTFNATPTEMLQHNSRPASADADALTTIPRIGGVSDVNLTLGILVGTSITSLIKMYNTNGVRLELDCREILEMSPQIQASQTERFRTKYALDLWSTVSAMK